MYILLLFYECMYLQHGVISANAKLALFFDWLLYNKDTDNIMNVGECFRSNNVYCTHVCT